ncbi:MAG: SDR family NAD(P)-dependent oxidoreductase, partial [Syntrophomonas sp.]|nr:SDR family NAD(P)-dependent oxidoreductase [Syntrophomonas sp.]
MSKPVALVTGSSRGLGRAIAIELAKTCTVAINYYDKVDAEGNRAQAQEVLDLIEQAGGSGVVLGADVSDPASAAQLVE